MLQALEESYVVKAVTEVPVTLAVVVGLVFTGGMQVAVGAVGDAEALVSLGAISKDHLDPLDSWRLLTASWLHASEGHWSNNVSLLLPMGLMVESAAGSRRTCAVFAAACTLGSLACLALEMPDVGVGISDGVFGLLGMAMAMAVAPAGRLSAAHSRALRRYVLPLTWLAMLRSLTPGISVAAHGAGLLVGLLAVATGLVWLGVPRRFEGEAHRWEPWSVVRWTLAAMVCGCADLALFLVSIGLCVAVWLDLAHDAEPPADLAGVSTVVGGVGAGILAAGWLGVMGLGWIQLPEQAEAARLAMVTVHPDLPPIRDPSSDATFEVLPRPDSPDEAVELLLEGVERPAVVDVVGCPTVWWKDCARRLFPTVIVRSCSRDMAKTIRSLPCEGATLPPLQLGVLSDGGGHRMQARGLYARAAEARPNDPRVPLLQAQDCDEITQAVDAVSASDDPWGWRDAAVRLARCNAEQAAALMERFDAARAVEAP